VIADFISGVNEISVAFGMRRDVSHYDMHSFRLYAVCDTIIRAKENLVEDDVILRGQDGVVHMHNNPAPPARRRPAERTTEQLLLMLQPADAAAIRIAAEALGMTHSAFVARLVAVAGDPMKLARDRDQHTDAAQLAAAVHQRLEIVRRARADFGRAGGLVKSLFVRDNETRGRAEEHADELSDALREFLAIGKRIEEMLEEVGDDLAPIFSDIAAAARRLSGR
jgi:hypothetical protein